MLTPATFFILWKSYATKSFRSSPYFTQNPTPFTKAFK